MYTIQQVHYICSEYSEVVGSNPARLYILYYFTAIDDSLVGKAHCITTSVNVVWNNLLISHSKLYSWISANAIIHLADRPTSLTLVRLHQYASYIEYFTHL